LDDVEIVASPDFEAYIDNIIEQYRGAIKNH
jgi:hypothetical protein